MPKCHRNMRAEDKAAMCDGKVSFTNLVLAQTIAARKYGRSVYRCFSCGTWHVGHHQPRKSRRVTVEAKWNMSRLMVRVDTD